MTQDLGPLFTILTTLGSAVVASAGLGVWIVTQFANQRSNFYKALETQRISFEQKVEDHETLDQTRHEDNLKEFRTISNTLVRLEYNGRGGVKPVS